MFDRVLNTPLDDTSRLDRSSKCLLLWKPSIFIVLSIIRDQGKTKTIPHTIFETFINSNSRYKIQKVSWRGFFELEMLKYSQELFYKESLLELEVVKSGSLKYYKVFSFKNEKRIIKKVRGTKKNNKNSSHGRKYKIQCRHWKQGKNEKRKTWEEFNNEQKQLSRGVVSKRCSENMQHIYRRTPMPKCDFNKVAEQLYWNEITLRHGCSPVNLLHIFRTLFY